MRARLHPVLVAATVLLGACTATQTTEGRVDDRGLFDSPALTAVLVPSATASLVTLELRITNVRTAPLTAQFSSSQQYDFRVRRLDGSTAWVWSADKAFTAALTSRTFAPGETVVYTATWTPTERGSFVADGWLTSSSHAAAASTALSVP